MSELVLRQFEDLRRPWNDLYQKSETNLLFSSLCWAELWWQHFGAGNELRLGSVEENGKVIGIAPMRLKDSSLYFIGSDNVCDFLDFIIEPGREDSFFNTLLQHWASNHRGTVDLSPLLPGSNAYSRLAVLAQGRGLQVTCTQQDVTVSLDLPANLPAYLSLLSAKQRHELLRKERRLNEEGEITCRISNKAAANDLDTFLQFFRESREDKSRFLTGTMEAFFRAIIQNAAANNMLRLGMLELNSSPVAATICFDYRDTTYLYNSGYNPDYRWLSVGLLSKYFSIQSSLENGNRRYDFLKGSEQYKFHLGGKETPLFRCIINF
jgi:CelD/BcsL family acetyltransferase involved in cellulose biosynthesis